MHFGIADVPLTTELGLDADGDDARPASSASWPTSRSADDLHGSARYRRHLAEVLGARAAGGGAGVGLMDVAPASASRSR